VHQDPQLLQLPPMRPLRPMTLRETGTPCSCNRGRKWNQQCLYELCKHCCDAQTEAGNIPYPCTAPSHKSGGPSRNDTSSTNTTTLPPHSSPYPPTSTPARLSAQPPPLAASLPSTTQKPSGQRYPLWEEDEAKRRGSVEVVESNRRQRQILEIELRSVRKVHFFHTVCSSSPLWMCAVISLITGW